MKTGAMGETIHFIKEHLGDNFALYFPLLYLFGGRPGAILSALAVNFSIYLVLPAVVILDTFQIPMFHYLYGTVSKHALVRKIAGRARRRTARLSGSKLMQRLSRLGPLGVVAIAMLPLKGCGMWSGVLMARWLKLPQSRSYSLLILGSVLGCLLLVGAGEALLRLLGVPVT